MCYLSAETLILLGVIVLQSNLELNSLSEDLGFPFLVLGLVLLLDLLLLPLFGGGNDLENCGTQHVAWDLAA